MGEAWDVLVCEYCGKTIGKRSRRYNPREDRPGRVIPSVCKVCLEKRREIENNIKQRFIEFFERISEEKGLKTVEEKIRVAKTIAHWFFMAYWQELNLIDCKVSTELGYPEITYKTKENFEITIEIVPTGFKII